MRNLSKTTINNICTLCDKDGLNHILYLHHYHFHSNFKYYICFTITFPVFLSYFCIFSTFKFLFLYHFSCFSISFSPSSHTCLAIPLPATSTSTLTFSDLACWFVVHVMEVSDTVPTSHVVPAILTLTSALTVLKQSKFKKHIKFL